MNARMIVDVGLAIDVAKGATYPKNYDDNQCIESLCELLWWNEEATGNEYDLTAEQYAELVEPYLQANWSEIKPHIKFV